MSSTNNANAVERMECASQMLFLADGNKITWRWQRLTKHWVITLHSPDGEWLAQHTRKNRRELNQLIASMKTR